MKVNVRVAFLALILFLVYSTVFGFAAESSVEIHFLDVGQGDSTLIISNEKTVLIDAGTTFAGQAVVVPYLKNLGIDRIDVLIATHPHSDHIGGLIPVLENFAIGEVWADGQIHTSRTYENFLNLILKKDIPFNLARANQRVRSIEENTLIDEFIVLHPQEEFINGLNNNSVVIKLKIGEHSFLFTGDIEKEAEELLVNLKSDLTASVLKVAHHGSDTSSSEKFLDAVQPSIAVIPVGKNTYGHPSKIVLERLAERGVKIYSTANAGTIVISVTQDSIQVNALETVVRMEEKIELRTATKQDLMKIPGIGEVLAQRIIDYRQLHGLTSIDELINVNGIGPALLERIKQHAYIDFSL